MAWPGHTPSDAYDQVPLHLAGTDNTHTNDPERFAGEVLDAEVQPDGLWITLRATERGNRVLETNPGPERVGRDRGGLREV